MTLKKDVEIDHLLVMSVNALRMRIDKQLDKTWRLIQALDGLLLERNVLSLDSSLS